MVRQRSAKPLSAGSIPAVASILTPPEFNFRSTVESHGWYRLAPFSWSSDDAVLHRVELLNDKPIKLAIAQTEGGLIVRPPGAMSEELRTKLTRIFQLNVNLADFHELTRKSPPHTWVAPAGFGRLLCGATLFEDIVKIICTTNVTWSQTVRMVANLVDVCGRGGAFPEPRDVTAFDAPTLQERCRLGYRAKPIRALAAGIVDGSIDLAEIADPSRSTEELFASYMTLPGVGPYGAAHLLAMDGRHDFIAVDTEFRRFVRETYHGGRKVADATMLRRYSKWGRWKYLAYWAELWGSVADRLHRPQSE